MNTYNEVKKCKDYDYDVLVINDGSTDNEEEILEENNIPHIKLIQNLGIGGAVQTGYKYALMNNYDIAIQLDGDGQHDIKYAKKIIEPITKNKADLVIGSRFCTDEKEGFKSSKARRVGINFISGIIKLNTGKKIYDTTSGFRAANKKVIEIFAKSYPTEYPEPVSEEALLRRGYIINEVPVIMRERTAGKSSIHAWKNLYYMINVTLSIWIESFRRYKD